jgi:hypothetical protein
VFEFFGTDRDLHAQERCTHGFAQVVQTQVACAAALQRAV